MRGFLSEAPRPVPFSDLGENGDDRTRYRRRVVLAEAWTGVLLTDVRPTDWQQGVRCTLLHTPMPPPPPTGDVPAPEDVVIAWAELWCPGALAFATLAGRLASVNAHRVAWGLPAFRLIPARTPERGFFSDAA